MSQSRLPPAAVERLPITFEAGKHTLTLTLGEDWRWTLAIDGQRHTEGTYPTQAEAWEAGIREAYRLG
ncbi:MAG: DUF2188 domain-containing protein [Anaeromyxobacter sp.]